MTDIKRVAFVTPTITRPYQPFLDSMEETALALEAAGIENFFKVETGSAYISHARATGLRHALDVRPDAVIFLDHDISFKPEAIFKLLETDDPVVAGTYRFKQPKEEYMGRWRHGEDDRPLVREDGCIRAEWVPAGFLKVTERAIHDFMESYPELVYGQRYRPSVDLFNHGAHEWVWWGEDYAFSRRWNERGGEIWIVPDLDLTHHAADGAAYPGNFRTYLRKCPGGDLASEPLTQAA